MEKLIDFAMCGSSGGECNPYDITRPVEVQRILLLINSEPLNVNEISTRTHIPLDKVVEHLDKLVKCGLVREENGLYKPAFPIFTLRDQRILQPPIDDMVDIVVGAVKNSRTELEKTISSLSIVKRGLRFIDLDYIIVGAITLDYEGLNVLEREGLIVKSKKMPGGGEYVFAGFEVGLLYLKEKWMWGHSGFFDKYWFSSHGKLPRKGRRKAFPDLAWSWYEWGLSVSEIESEMTVLGRILELLAYKDYTFNDLAMELNIDKQSLAVDLTLLLTLGYVAVDDKLLWKLSSPVFTREDYENIKSFSKHLLENIASEFKDKRNIIEEYYEETTPARNGIPLQEAFNQVYHLVFEKALNKLIGEGVINEPPLRLDGAKYSVFTIILK